MTSAFVTGGSGFVGGALIRRLVAEGVRVRALARSCAAHLGDWGSPEAFELVTDGPPIVFREFVTRLLATQRPAAARAQGAGPGGPRHRDGGETAWRTLHLPGRQPLTRLAVRLASLEATIDISRARDELGCAPVKGP